MIIQDIILLVVAGVFIGSWQTGLIPFNNIIDLTPLILMVAGYIYLRFRIYKQELSEIELEEIAFSKLVRERLRAL